MGRVCDSGVRVVSPSPTLDVGGAHSRTQKARFLLPTREKTTRVWSPCPSQGCRDPGPRGHPRDPCRPLVGGREPFESGGGDWLLPRPPPEPGTHMKRARVGEGPFVI